MRERRKRIVDKNAVFQLCLAVFGGGVIYGYILGVVGTRRR